jgi:hypothetical protein
MFGKQYLDQRDAAEARAKIRAAINLALAEIEDGPTRDAVRREFTGGNVEYLQLSAMQNAQVEAYNRMRPTDQRVGGLGFFGGFW